MLTVHTSPLARLGGRDTGGMNVYIKALSTELASRGVLVDVYTRAADPSTPLVQEEAPGFRTINLRVGPEAALSRERLHELTPDLANAADAFRISEGLEYDVLHSHYWLSGLLGLRLAQKWRAPWAHMSHTLGVLKDAHRGPHQEPESLLRLRSEAAVLHAADGVIASNQTERDEVLNRYGLDAERVYIAPCGVDLSLFQPGSPRAARARLGLRPEQRIALYVGRIEPLKGLDTLLRAAAILSERVTDLRVILVGGVSQPGDLATEAELRRLRSLAAELRIEHVVDFYGPVEQSRLPDLYRAADVSVAPSHYESFGMAALESLACGTPVVASRVGGLQSTIRDGENGFLAPVDGARDFARRIEQVMCRPELRARLSDGAARAARRYSWQRVADHNLGIYHNLLAPAPVEAPLLVGCELSA